MPEPGAPRANWRVVVMVVGVAVVAVVVATAPQWFARGSARDFAEDVRRTTRADLEFDVAPGTSERIQEGETVYVLPSPLVVSVGDTIRIRNRDRDPILLGPFWVGAHATLTQRFVEPGRFTGDCLAHPSGRLVVEVRP